ncbi:precorrin-2 dehydrogenase/sirohydrochlorin ferrochelatase family protein [Desulfovibrio inopinatus]|uniref:precorrin-2 dehydrogenase/sirohydrochlorin ferrochelatase family protein n=1 Tax=Desulfovibrio inopinatus TaxID=102109 RepID=UPI000422CE88|nr:bifunctional precorrin-2 dehydrogenase/sirohydrochlorin ferrochelatase [Desulfovibrio inopinatus]
MRYYPIFIDLKDKRCLVVGAGGVGIRKVEGLLEANPKELLVVDITAPSPKLSRLLDDPRVVFANRSFVETDLNGRFLVIASTSNDMLNAEISRLCHARGILCNIIDQPEKCSFIVPAVHNRGELTVAVSTGGASPALARKIRRELDTVFGEEYAAMLTLMRRLRPVIIDLGYPSTVNSEFFRRLVHSDLMDALAAQDRSRAKAALEEILPPEAHPRIEDLLHDLC